MAAKRILIVNPFGIGDVLFSTPLIRAVRRAFPDAYLAYLCNRRTEEILRRNRYLDELFIYEKDELVDLWRRGWVAGLKATAALLEVIRRRRFDLAIDLSLGERYSLVLALFGVSRRIGFDFRHRGRFLSHRLWIDGYQDQHVVEYYRQLLEMIGVRMLESELDLVVEEPDRHSATRILAKLGLGDGDVVIGLVPAGGVSWGGQAHYRRWPKEAFVQVGQALGRQYRAKILVFGESKDRDVCAEIAQAIGSPAVDLSGQTTLGQFVGLVQRCQIMIATDGGPIHIAASQGVSTVSIFGPVDPEVYGPYPHTAKHRVIYKADLPCRPCYHQFKLPPCPYERACLTSVTPADVLEACEAMLGTDVSRGVHGASHGT